MAKLRINFKLEAHYLPLKLIIRIMDSYTRIPGDDNEADQIQNQLPMYNERKTAKLNIILSSIGIFAGLSASASFLFAFKLIDAPLIALISALIASFSCYIHVSFLKNKWQIWTYQLKYWNLIGLVLLTMSIVLFFTYLILAIYYKQRPTVNSYYMPVVWSFMCIKWSFALFFFTKKYRLMFNRYSVIDEPNEI